MKQDDFERLKAICEREGLYFDFDPISVTAVVAKKTDPWEGVEFAYHEKGVVEKIKEIKGDFVYFEPYGRLLSSPKVYLTPSTETAYVEQLKKEAYDWFGKIKEGDRFKMIASDSVIKKFGSLSPLYIKNHDSFSIGGVTIYEKGKWAERVKERAEITFVRSEYSGPDIISFSFRDNTNGRHNEAGPFLASQLEKYLNGEIE